MAVRDKVIEAGIQGFFDDCSKQGMTNEEVGILIQSLGKEFQNLQQLVIAEWANKKADKRE